MEYYKSVLKELYDKCDEVAGQWSGEESGLQEEKALGAKDIQDNIKAILETIEEVLS